MDLLHGNVKQAYWKYFSAAFGSALISSIYYIVDTAVVGQYQGPEGTAALAVAAPSWNLIYSLGLLTGIGGAVLCSTSAGKGEEDKRQEYFSAALLLTAFLGLLSWGIVSLFQTPLLRFFGAEETLLPIAQEYIRPILFVLPLFTVNQMLAAFLRNDNDPGRATAAVIIGSVFNIIADIVFVFPMNMGVFGAGLATAMGSALTTVLMLPHFRSVKNTFHLRRPTRIFHKLGQILATGFPTFIVDAAMGILTILFNRQIVHWLGTDALAVYGVVVNISTIVQSCSYSAGEAAQPIISINFGAGYGGRIRETLQQALCTVAFFSLAWTAVVWLFPNGFIRVFMDATPAVLEIAPAIMRAYGISFLLLPLNIFSTFYFQAILRPFTALGVSVFRGLLVSGALILLLPVLLGANALWFAMPITELIVGVPVILLTLRSARSMQ